LANHDELNLIKALLNFNTINNFQ